MARSPTEIIQAVGSTSGAVAAAQRPYRRWSRQLHQIKNKIQPVTSKTQQQLQIDILSAESRLR